MVDPAITISQDGQAYAVPARAVAAHPYYGSAAHQVWAYGIFGSSLGFAGWLASLFLLLTVAVFYVTVKREEAWLTGAFGQTYLDYCERTPRFGPDFSKWRDAESLDVRPRFFLTTLRDGLVFLLAVPLFESVERLQDIGWLSALIHLP